MIHGRPLSSMVLLAVVSACAPMTPPGPMTLPAADGRAADIVIGDGFRYVVSLQGLDQSLGGVVLRVSRASPPELGYSDGLVAREVADAYCAGFGRTLNPVAYGKFSTPASWLFEGGCT